MPVVLPGVAVVVLGGVVVVVVEDDPGVVVEGDEEVVELPGVAVFVDGEDVEGDDVVDEVVVLLVPWLDVSEPGVVLAVC